MRKNVKGSTLVEAMVAMIILAALVIGAAPFIIHGSGRVAVYKNKLAALAVANGRLERIRATDYATIKPAVQSYTVYFLNSSLTKSTTNPNETANINGASMPMVTTIQYVDRDPSDTLMTYDYLHAIVTVNDKTGSSENVRLETYIGPYNK